jgi:uncharacterized membrane protein
VNGALGLLTGVAAVGSATVGGVFYAFSTFVMPALRRLSAPQGMAAMQAINIAAVRPGLMTALFGTAGACIAVAVGAALSWHTRRSLLLITGSALYLIGGVGVTAAHNVPLNNQLARLDPADPDTDQAWHHYLRAWTAGNHLRTGACLAGAALLTWALSTDGPDGGA